MHRNCSNTATIALMKAFALLAAALPVLAIQLEPVPPLALQKLQEEADRFAEGALRVVGTEVLEQRAIVAPPRFRLRVGAAAATPSKGRWQTKQLVSEYGYSTLKPGGPLHEFRQVVSVDGKPVARAEEARVALVKGISSDDDRYKQRMLRDFERYGLVGGATDFGQLILLFASSRRERYDLRFTGTGRVGPDRAVVLSFRQKDGEESLTIFEGRSAHRQRLNGSIWLRADDYLPLKIQVISERTNKDRIIRDVGTVEYFKPSRQEFLLPASVLHQQFVNGEMTAENRFRYTGFRRFSTDSEIRFDTDSDSPQQNQ
jgi:hypothetical protein